MRLIDADNIKYTRLLSQQGLDMELVAKVAIDNMPTVDAEPVRHAILESTGYDEAWCEWGNCSNCGTSNIITSKFCNECGARFKEGYHVADKERSH